MVYHLRERDESKVVRANRKQSFTEHCEDADGDGRATGPIVQRKHVNGLLGGTYLYFHLYSALLNMQTSQRVCGGNESRPKSFFHRNLLGRKGG